MRSLLSVPSVPNSIVLGICWHTHVHERASKFRPLVRIPLFSGSKTARKYSRTGSQVEFTGAEGV